MASQNAFDCNSISFKYWSYSYWHKAISTIKHKSNQILYNQVIPEGFLILDISKKHSSLKINSL